MNKTPKNNDNTETPPSIQNTPTVDLLISKNENTVNTND